MAFFSFRNWRYRALFRSINEMIGKFKRRHNEGSYAAICNGAFEKFINISSYAFVLPSASRYDRIPKFNIGGTTSSFASCMTRSKTGYCVVGLISSICSECNTNLMDEADAPTIDCWCSKSIPFNVTTKISSTFESIVDKTNSGIERVTLLETTTSF